MNKLRKKVFITLFLILTISLLGFISIFNVQTYLQQENLIEETLTQDNGDKKDNPQDIGTTPPPNQDDSQQADGNNPPLNEEQPSGGFDSIPTDENGNPSIKFMDSVVYTVKLNSDNEVIDVLNLSNNDVSEDEIKKIAETILASDNLSEKHIGNLYIEDYVYSYRQNDYLTIVDNTSTSEYLLKYLRNSLILLVVLEVIVYFISKYMTKWLTKPVEESFEKQKQFIGDASHELKTPLSVIVASSDALEKHPEEVKWLTNIRYEADRMNTLITRLLDLSSSEKDETYFFKEDNLSKTVELSCLTFEGKAYEAGITLKQDIKENINFNYDETSIKQLVEILLDNAIKHAYKNTEIEVSLDEVGHSVILKVMDTGDPIPKGEEEKIFERFYRVDKARNRKENRYGLGLAIAKNITEKHNGTIKAYSNDDKTTFEVTLKK